MKDRYTITEAALALDLSPQETKYLQKATAHGNGLRVFSEYITARHFGLMAERRLVNVLADCDDHKNDARVARDACFVSYMLMAAAVAAAVVGWWMYFKAVA
jgi:hypothetical protein